MSSNNMNLLMNIVVSSSYILMAGSLEGEMGIGQGGKRKHVETDMASGSSLNL